MYKIDKKTMLRMTLRFRVSVHYLTVYLELIVHLYHVGLISEYEMAGRCFVRHVMRVSRFGYLGQQVADFGQLTQS